MEQHTGTQRTIVIVEDNPADVFLVREALQAYGIVCDLKAYDTGEEAVKGLSRYATGESIAAPNLILLDWNLPAIGGADVLRALRQWPRFQSLPVAILTSSGSPSDRTEAFRLGATRFIQKPMGYEEFIEQVGQQVRELLA